MATRTPTAWCGATTPRPRGRPPHPPHQPNRRGRWVAAHSPGRPLAPDPAGSAQAPAQAPPPLSHAIAGGSEPDVGLRTFRPRGVSGTVAAGGGSTAAPTKADAAAAAAVLSLAKATRPRWSGKWTRKPEGGAPENLATRDAESTTRLAAVKRELTPVDKQGTGEDGASRVAPTKHGRFTRATPERGWGTRPQTLCHKSRRRCPQQLTCCRTLPASKRDGSQCIKWSSEARKGAKLPTMP